MRIKERIENVNKYVLFHYEMGSVMTGGGDFYIRKLSDYDIYEVEGFACYDGYVRVQYDNFEEAYKEFQSWVDERLPEVLKDFRK